MSFIVPESFNEVGRPPESYELKQNVIDLKWKSPKTPVKKSDISEGWNGITILTAQQGE